MTWIPCLKSGALRRSRSRAEGSRQSWSHTSGESTDRSSLSTYSRTAAYGQSNLMFTYELQRRLATHGTTVALAAHPRMSNTELARNTPAALRLLLTWLAPLITQTPSMGALPTLRAATDPAALGGQYYGPGGRNEVKGQPRLVTSSPESYEAALQQRLWTVSDYLTGVKFPAIQSMHNSFPSGSDITMSPRW
jgi:hypothetical protein